ncbi:hypothetical protein BKA67DRAFT_95659 [Truncatella angustata]|uniref:Rhodopsin domain-containing protein n=1 Tax=Truncatella angustata TaxID=152316 RepID=A0A9P8UCR7_9PEZI|nr:uncharacterized protein BKA67DRAFT_95659 [Truncatella angustata]KAH6646162.1 hypothetical protein BKA67DRAFT_95659 [Truncatella angustata]
MIKNGLGRQAISVSQGELEMFLKILVVSQIIFVTGIALVKLSILLMYLRIFTSKGFKLVVYIVIVAVAAWWAAITLLSIFQCKPIEKSFRPWIDGQCITLEGAYYGSSVPSIVTDFIILCLPIHQVIKLKTTKTNRAIICFFFATGAFATFASIERFLAVFQVDHLNGTWTLTVPLGWAMIEQSSAVVSACLPTLRPLLVTFYKWSGLQKSISERSRAVRASRPSNIDLVTIGGGSGSASQRRDGSGQQQSKDRGISTYISNSSFSQSRPKVNDEERAVMVQPDHQNGIHVQVEHSARWSLRSTEQLVPDDNSMTHAD